MIAQQTNVDTIANNLANVNTVGYKTEVAEFKSLLYQNMQKETTTSDGEQKPISAQVGLGVRNSAITSIFKQGPMLESQNPFSFAIQGDGFFAVQGEGEDTYYTRNGYFNLSMGSNGMTLANSDGLPVLDTSGRPIVFNRNLISTDITVDDEGKFYYPDDDDVPQELGIQIGLFQFNNPAGLTKNGDSLYTESSASGEPINETRSNNLKKSSLMKGYLEGSGVQVADEMVNLIVAQRAYELNSKAITTSDTMMELANQLKR